MIHAFHEIGSDYTIDGTKYPLLRPQGTFGIFVTHEGQLNGWRYHIQGAREVSPNWYELEVPNDGAERITVGITAVESPPPGPIPGPGGGGIPWWVFLIIALVILLIIFVLVRAQSRQRP
jgi:hypothetical protein